MDECGDAYVWGQRMYQPITRVTEVAHTPEKVRRIPVPLAWVAVAGWAHGHGGSPGRRACTSNLRPDNSAARKCSPRFNLARFQLLTVAGFGRVWQG